MCSLYPEIGKGKKHQARYKIGNLAADPESAAGTPWTTFPSAVELVSPCPKQGVFEMKFTEALNIFIDFVSKTRFPDKQWLNSHLKKIKQRAGSRYTPELNVDLPIAEIFDGISRTKDFYTSIRNHLGKLEREFGRVSPKYKDEKAQRLYKNLRKEISSLAKLTGKVKEFNTSTIPWKNINRRTRRAEKLLWNLSDKLHKERTKTEQHKTSSEQDKILPASERFSYDIHSLHETQKELHYFEELSSSAKAELSNNPFLLLTGLAGIGKTHLLCDVVEGRISGKTLLPSILVFGESFETDENPWEQIISQLGLRMSKDMFLQLLNGAGKKSGSRTLLIIDALNETKRHNFWKRNLNEIVDGVKKCPNVALIVSIRSGFEGEVLTKKQREGFVHEEHSGFQFREWEAVTKFFKEFNLPLPEIPLLMPEFQYPLFLLLFCKAFQERSKRTHGKKEIFRGHEGATYIFETFVDSVSKRLSKQFGIDSSAGKNVWDTVIEKIATEIVEQNDDRISEDQLIAIVQSAYPSISHGHFIKELERNLLLVKIPRYSQEKKGYDGFDFRFSFQKFSDHLIGRYLFKKYEKEFGKANKNLETAKRFFSKRRKLGKFLSSSRNRGVVEALSIQCPEHLKGLELVEVAPYLKNSHVAQEAFVEGLIWRKPEAFSGDLKNTIDYINAEIIKTKSGHNSLLDAFLAVALIPNHPFNANFLHKHLSKFSMAKRDSWWSTFLHYQYGGRGAVDRLIEWGWSEQDKSHISDESLKLCSIALAWFLTTPNRFLRDKSTKTLAALLTNKLNIVLELLKQFQVVNDSYISERLYAVAYGCALRSKNDKKHLKDLATWIYKNVFATGNPPVHILLRDYARGVVEVALQQKLQLRINKRKIEPPYKSKWPTKFPSNKTVEEYEINYKDKNFKDYFWAQNSIISSMQPEYSEISMYGDFGRYTFQSALSNFKFKEGVSMQKLSNWATKRVFDLGYDVKLHGEFDRNLSRYHSYGRSDHKPERIGKKYQWIAFHEISALVSDHFQIKERISWEEKTVPYEGPWQIGIRDIDPSCTLKEFPNPKPSSVPVFKEYVKYDPRNNRYSDPLWLKKKVDLPDPRRIIEIKDTEGNLWVTLEGFLRWQEDTPPEQEKYQTPARTFWYALKSYLVMKKDLQKIFTWAQKQDFRGGWMPESAEFYDVFLGEYPWMGAFLYHYAPYSHHDGWVDKVRKNKIPARILTTNAAYLSSGSGFDCSTEEAIKLELPVKWIVNKMGLKQNSVNGMFFNRKNELVTFDPSLFDDTLPSILLIDKERLRKFLNSKGYAVFWTLLGEKNMIGGWEIGQPLGWLEVDGVYTFNNRYRVVGSKRSIFKK